jgi:hypothetical protein
MSDKKQTPPPKPVVVTTNRDGQGVKSLTTIAKPDSQKK